MNEDNSDEADSLIESSLSAIAIGAIITFVGSVFVRVAGLLERVIVARFLGPETYGKIALGLTILNLGTLIGLVGLQIGLVKVLPTSASSSEQRGYVSFSLQVVTITLVVVASGVFLFAEVISKVVFDGGVKPNQIRIFAVIIPLSGVGRMSFATAQGLKDARVRTLIKDFVQPGARMIFVVAAILVGIHSAINLSYAYLAGYTVFAAIGVYYFYIIFGKTESGDIDRVGFLRYSAPLFFAGGFRLLADSIDSIFIGAILTPSAVGVYDAAYTLANQVLFASTLFAVILMPVMSEYYENGDLDEMKDIFLISTRWTIIITLPAYLVLLFEGETLITAIFGSEFLAGTTSLAIVATGFLAFTLFGLNNATLNMIGDSDFVLFASIVNVGVNISLNLYLIPRFGIEGAAVATAVSFTLPNSLIAVRLFTSTGIVPWNLVSLKSFIVLLVVSLLVYLPLNTLLSGLLVPILMYGGTIIVFIPLYYQYFATDEERGIAADYVPIELP